ncbi:hypothetical protein [Streptomyces subrutilus]|uniref:hypothetical protein n=1 Tax=Streptomyces subrutilus TaxID=36818 RepID=UPI00114CBFF7|nr:hypothetical protein [Streptomyces subrutilus]
MPHSLHRALATERSAYTGETPSAAAPGTTRDGQLGLDHCSRPQRRLRALLAIAVLNCGPDAAWLAETSLHELSVYTFALSPRYDDLIVISNAAENIGNRLLPSHGKREGLCLPGMRLVEYTGESMHLLHLPSGARMTTTRNRNGLSQRSPVNGDWWWHTDKPLTDRERNALAALPSLTPDAEVLLASLLVRFCLQDPEGGWDIGM